MHRRARQFRFARLSLAGWLAVALCAEPLLVHAAMIDTAHPQASASGKQAAPSDKDAAKNATATGNDAGDMSKWLLQKKRALVVPIIITEPAVGNGGGAALTFFRPAPQSTASRQKGERLPPDIYGFGAARTQNGTYGGALFGDFHMRDDRWRYRGVLGKASLNLDFYSRGVFSQPHKIAYNLDGVFSSQQVSRRLGSLPLYASVNWVYINLDNTLEAQSDRQYFLPHEFAQRASGLGVALEYDTRDNTLTPSDGWLSTMQATFYGSAIGSDNTFQAYRFRTLAYLPIGARFVLGARVDWRAVDGDVPFYQLPSVDLRGVSYGRYQDRRVGVLEAELRWNVAKRWAAVAFAGAGRAWGRQLGFSETPTAVSKGVGVRYLIASSLGLYVGIDWAWSQQDHAFYIQIGSAWR